MGICFSEYILDAKSQLHANGIIKMEKKSLTCASTESQSLLYETRRMQLL
ncbi:hypothetical protein HanIR_Chr08g0384401 [Helianthus annuus]|nr:hypothetical protein HanIR_Chr08g0384401 [Helianthus annuus]